MTPKAIRKYNAMIAVLIIGMTALQARDWPQFLGPDRNSTSSQKNLLRTWPEGGPEVLWAVDVGRGYAGPVVKDQKVYLLDRDDQVGDMLRCFDLDSGEELWSAGYDSSGSFGIQTGRFS
jgi:hypothetical protein